MTLNTRLAAIAVSAGVIIGGSMAGAVDAAPPDDVDFTIAETLDPSPGSLIEGSIPGCASPSVVTAGNPPQIDGDRRTFTGTKTFNCDGGDTFTLAYRATVVDCADTDAGRWRIIGGTGSLAGIKGGGSLVGTYVGGDSCNSTGINDRYTGKIKL